MAARRSPAQPVSYEVACACGEQCRGQRTPRHQVVHCPACNAPVFILPSSPLPPVGTSGASRSTTALHRHIKPWIWPVAGATVTLVAVIVGFVVLVRGLANRSDTPRHESLDIRGRIAAGKRSLAGGTYHEAAEHFEAARLLHEKNPQAVSAAERRELSNLRRQASLLAALLSESLEEVLGHAAGVPEMEWETRFDAHYKGSAVVFDGAVSRDAPGQCHLNYRLFVRDEPVRLVVGELKLLRSLPLADPRRLLFGARLASIRREKGAAWVVRFDPDSGVLLTDRGAASACCFQPIDAELEAVLRWQEARQAELQR